MSQLGLRLIVVFAFVVVSTGQDVIKITNKPAFFPEGIEYTDKTGFLVGSGSGYKDQGSVWKLSTTGTVTPFVTKNDTFLDVLGLHADVAKDFLYIASSDTGQFQGHYGVKQALFVKASLSTGAVITSIDLTSVPSPHATGRLANDLVNDPDGNVYITDSLGGQIWKIDTNNQATSFVADARFALLNGIEYKNGYLLASGSGNGKLWRITVSDHSVSEVMLPQPISGDGIFFNGENLVLVTATTVYEIASSDSWASAKIVKNATSAFGGSTTGALKTDKTIWITHCHFDQVTNTSVPSTFEIEKITLVDVPNMDDTSSSNASTVALAVSFVVLLLAFTSFY